jgi:acetyl-CoA carboxylase carboxyl transferase subunit beta
VAKITTHAKTRNEAIGKMRQALNELVIEGIETNINLQKQILNNKDFVSGDYRIGMPVEACTAHTRLSAREMIKNVADKNSFKEMYSGITTQNPIAFPDYEEKIKNLSECLDINEAVIVGLASIHDHETMICAMDSRFIMGSMGSAVGEKITRAFETAAAKRLPMVIFTASGGARMQEGIISLMQMAKVSAAVKRHSDAGLLYIAVLTDPTTGGVTASFAMQADIILAEPAAIVGFAGRRVIEQTIKEKLPDDFQSSESALSHGFIDKIVARKDMRDTLGSILGIHNE